MQQNTPMNPQQPGPMTPGSTGGLPAPHGLTVGNNPMAEQLRSMGRGEDSMLVHMTPNEVNSLQGLALASGGSLTINPHTGLPEAGWLGKLLPTILGVAGAAFGIPTWAMGLGGTAIGTAVTGDLGKGLMAGLGAYGGAGLGNALGLGGALGNVGGAAAGTAAPAATTASSAGPVDLLAQAPGGVGSGVGTLMQTTLPGGATSTALASGAGQAAKTGFGGFVDRFKQATNIPGLGNVGAMAGGLGVLNNLNAAMTPDLPKYKEDDEYKYEGPYVPTDRPVTMPTTSARERGGAEHLFFEDSNPVPGYQPYKKTMGMAEGGSVPRRGERDFGFKSLSSNIPAATPNTAASPGGKGNIRDLIARIQTNKLNGTPTSSSPPPSDAPWKRAAAAYTPGRERDFGFLPAQVSTPAPQTTDTPTRTLFGRPYNEGGEVDLSDGSFVLDARTVSEIGNGSSNAGIEALRKMGGRPVHGPGDGVSDSVPARIDGRQPARVARDEVIMPADAVRRIGKGNEKRGAQKLYDLMDKAHKARKQAERGKDTGLRRGLA